MDAEDAELLDLAIAESERMKKLIRDLQSLSSGRNSCRE
jgi:hypothetical protein